MFNYNLAAKVFDAFSIRRWTDFFTPCPFVEIEKHALKAMLVFMIGKKYEALSGEKLDWEKMRLLD